MSDPNVLLLESKRTIIFWDDVNEKSCAKLVSHLLTLNNVNNEPMRIIIHSPGGNCWDMFAVTDVMSTIRSPIHTEAIGGIMSAGVGIFIVGTQRTLHTNATVMCHQHSNYRYGKHHELESQGQYDKNLHEMLVRHYVKYTGLSKEMVKKNILNQTDVWLKPAQCLKLGIADLVI